MRGKRGACFRARKDDQLGACFATRPSAAERDGRAPDRRRLRRRRTYVSLSAPDANSSESLRGGNAEHISA